jgi:hypothetical protein
MKKLIFIAFALCLVSRYAHAQRKIEYGFDIGGGLGIQSINNNDIISNNSIRTFNANAVINFPVFKQYYVRTGISLSNKGTVITEDGLVTTNKITYFELPVTIIRKFNIPTLGKIIAGLGGYVASGFAGTIDYETPSSSNSDKVDFGDANDFQKYDAGLRAVTGIELNNRLTFNLAYDYGLYSIASQTLKDTGYTSVYNREFTITLGFKF